MKLHKHLIEAILDAVQEIFSTGKHADKVIEKYLKSQKKWGGRDRRFFAESVYEMVRWWRYLWWMVGQEPTLETRDLWNLWAAFRVRQTMEVPEWHEISIQVSHIEKRLSSHRPPRAILQSIPNWLDQLGEQEFAEDWPKILSALNSKAHVYLRTNTLKTTRLELQKKLLEEEVPTEIVKENDIALVLPQRKNVFVTQSFRQGLFEVQDLASQFVAPMLDIKLGLRVIDACAGAGGKSLHAAALMKNKGKIIALDIHEWKLNELKKRAARGGVDIIETRVIDGSKTIKRMEASADRLLLDVPCSGLGVLRRNPDTKWKLSLEEIDRLKLLQAEILEDYSKILKPGGIMVYATCSILPSENQNQVDQFLSRHPEFTMLSEKKLLPHEGPWDGFYACSLQKS